MPSHEQTGKDISFSEAVRFWFIDIQVNELTNNGHVIAEFEGSDHYKIVFERFSATAPFQNSGIATRLYEHGDSGNGDPLYPKTWLYLAGWGSDLEARRSDQKAKNLDLRFKPERLEIQVEGRSCRFPPGETPPQPSRPSPALQYPAARSLLGFGSLYSPSFLMRQPAYLR